MPSSRLAHVCIALACAACATAAVSVDGARATLTSPALTLEFQARGGKCVSARVATPGGSLELTDATGVFEDHLAGQSYLKSDFRRAAFALSAADDALVLTASTTSPELAGLGLTKRIRFIADNVVECRLELVNHGDVAHEIAWWHHQALHATGGTTTYSFPTSDGIETLPYDPQGTPSERWFRSPARPWLGAAVCVGKAAAAAVFIADWPSLDHQFCYRSDLYASLEWRTGATTLAPGATLSGGYRLVVQPGARAVHGVVGDAVIDASGPTPVIHGEIAAEVRVRAPRERLLAPAGKAHAGELAFAWPAGYARGSAVVVVAPTDGSPSAELAPGGGRFTYEPLPGRLAAAKRLPHGRHDILYSLDVPFRLTPWAKPYYRGTLATWILSPIAPYGETVSILKRFDLDHDVVSCDPSWEVNTWGMGDWYGQRSDKQANGRDLEFGYALEDLASERHYDVLILPTVIGWNAYPAKLREAIVRRVEAGAGLVLINPQECEEKPADDIALPRLSPFIGASRMKYHWYGDWLRDIGMVDGRPWRVAAGHETHPIVRGVCWSAIPHATRRLLDHRLADGADLVVAAGDIPVIATRVVGKGRVVALNFTTGRHGAGLTPEDDGEQPTWDYWEQYYNLVGRAALWAAGREPEIDVAFDAARAPASLTLAVDNRLRALDAELRVIVKDERGRVATDTTTAITLPLGASRHELPLKGAPGGTDTVEALLSAGGQRVAWGATQVAVAKAAEITGLTATPETIVDGGAISGEATLAGSGGGDIVIELVDPHGRILARQRQDVAAAAGAKVLYSFTVRDALSLVVMVRARLIRDGAVLSEREGDSDVVVTPVEPAFSDYEVIPWGYTAQRDIWEYKARAFRSFHASANSGVDRRTLRAGYIAKGRADPLHNALGIYYFDQEKQRLEDAWTKYKETRDTTLLKRSVCLADPAIRATIHDEVKRKVAEQSRYNPDTYFIGDESSLTCYTAELDLDFNDASIAAFRAWLRQRYGDIAALNAKWRTSFADFAAIVPFTIIEVEEDATKACGWAEHRTFMEEQYEDVVRLIRAAAKEADPNAEVELSGTQSSTSFNAMDWARMTRHVKRFLPYNIDYAYDQLRCFAPDVKLFALTGYGSTGAGVKNSLWNQSLHGLLSTNIFWEWSLVDTDLTPSRNAEDIGEVFAELRGRGIGRWLGGMRWVESPVAVYHSMPSIHAARTQKREKICNDMRNAWCGVVRGLGLQFDMISGYQVEEGLLARRTPKALVLPAVFALSPAEVAAIRAYVVAGGTAIADIDPGICDERCDFRAGGALADLFGDGATAGEKRVGKGRAILLGTAPEAAAVARLLVAAGATPTVPVRYQDGTALTRAEVIVMRHGAVRLLAIIKDVLDGVRRTTADGVEYFEPLPAGSLPPADRIVATLPQAAHVYDVRARRYLGETATIADELGSGEAKLYALLPYRVDALAVTCADAYAPGARLRIEVAIQATGAVADHVFHVRVVRGDDEVAWCARNLPAPGGKAAFVLPVELDAAGPFRLEVTDVATGTMGSHDFAR